MATTTDPADDRVVRLADQEGARWFRGSETDVLARYVLAARDARADLVIRVTADCPLLDPDQTDAVVDAAARLSGSCDYASNVLVRTLPRGLDTEALFEDVLERVHRLATSREAREHVTWFIVRERPELFLTHAVTDDADNSDLRWTVDTPDDLKYIRTLYEILHLDQEFVDYPALLKAVRVRPEFIRTDA